MNIGMTLSRAIRITFQHRALWVVMLAPTLLSFIGALLGAGLNFAFRPEDFMNATSGAEMLAAYARVFAVWLPLILLLLAISALSAVILLVVRGGVIAGVHSIETTGSASFSYTLGAGFRKLIPLLVFNIVLFLPAIVIGALVLVIFALPFISLMQSTLEQAESVVGGFVAALCAGIGLICISSIYLLIAAGVQVMGERAIVIEGAGPIAGLKRGWALFRANLGNVILLAVIVFLITAVIGFVLGLLGNLAVLPQMGNWIEQINRGDVPDTWEMINLPIYTIITLLTSIVGLFLNLFIIVVWTVAYRQFSGFAAPKSDLPPAPLPA